MNKFYPLKHWFTTALLGPLFWTLYVILIDDQSAESMFESFPIVFAFGLLFSLPIFIVYILIHRYLISTNLPSILIKCLLDILAIIGVFITLKIIGGSLVIPFTTFYSIAIILSSFFYRVKPTAPELRQ